MKKFVFSILIFSLFSFAFSLTPFQNGWSFDLEAHRGGRGLMPENTMAAFRNAIKIGATTLELDIAITKDGIPVISHDPFLNPQKVSKNGQFINEKILIKDLTYSQILEYDVGIMRSDYRMPNQMQIENEKMPSFEEVLAFVKEMQSDGKKYMINAETKTFPSVFGYTYDAKTFVNAILPLIKKYGLEDTVMIQSFNWETLKLVKEMDPRITTVALLQRIYYENPLWTSGLKLSDFSNPVLMAKSLGVDIISPYYKECTAETIKISHEYGMAVVPWTINDRSEMERFISMGVDGIITDYPNLLKSLLISN
ncbi:glycerophosphodiester phosphodiesterase family protein [Athalassotoga saccharophila]|uniref:glycerophosphodiester phosphodiesterase family protein n=1 Tax=Athalassotoga saccharophila TaxID=1441386 RepID=UPI0013797D10|nr:glycerophosphodiester phosphodiesterase family protein [Athalassotoga saccharophila]BBJ28431.1 glycerophosphodiester phosphodiesterase [Athalassotoga saccharophila]